MAPSKDKEPITPEPAGEEPVGRVEFDNRGRSIWRWAREALDSTSILLKRLENDDLALEPTRKVPIMRGPKAGKAGKADRTAKAGKAEKPEKKSRSKDLALSVEHDDRDDDDDGGGFDPYNSRR